MIKVPTDSATFRVLAFSRPDAFPVGETWASWELGRIVEIVESTKANFEVLKMSVLFNTDLEFQRSVNYFPLIERLDKLELMLDYGLWVDVSSLRSNFSLRSFTNLVNKVKNTPGSTSIFLSVEKPFKPISKLKFIAGLHLLHQSLPEYDIILNSGQPTIQKAARDLNIQLVRPITPAEYSLEDQVDSLGNTASFVSEDNREVLLNTFYD